MDFGLLAAFRFGFDRAIVRSESVEAFPIESFVVDTWGCIRLLLRGGTQAVWGSCSEVSRLDDKGVSLEDTS